MGLFDQILSAIGDPNQQASPNQLGDTLSTVQQLANSYGVDPGTAQIALSMVGNYVRSALQGVRSQSGESQAQTIVNQYGGVAPNLQAVQTLFGQNQLGGMIDAIAQRTGLDSATIQAMLPLLVPVVLNLLKSGTSVQNPQGGVNPVLHAFLDADGNQQVDMADVLMLAGRFLNR